MAELFSKKQWAGEFFLPESHENRFFGEIHYSPEGGVILSYTITDHNVPAETEVLYGVLSEGEKCTLFGKFAPAHSATFRNGLITRRGKTGFPCFAVGDHLDHDEQFDHIDFSLTNLQEFFYPGIYKDFIKYSKEPIYSLDTPFGAMQVGNTAIFGPLHSDITSHIHNDNPAALDDLHQAFENIGAKYPKSPFMLKKDIAYRILLKFEPTLTLRDAYRHIVSFSNLFALLIYNPAYPESICLTKPRSIDNYPDKIQIYPSTVRDQRTINLCTRAHSHWNMPITQSTVSLDSIVTKWLQSPHNDSPIVFSIQNETGFRDQHTVHSEIILYATQLESISHGVGEEYKRRYEYPLEKYGCPKLCGEFKKIFGKSSLEEAAKDFGDLRNEVAHAGRPKQWLETLSLQELARISQCLQLVIIGYILVDIGVPLKVVGGYQERCLSDE